MSVPFSIILVFYSASLLFFCSSPVFAQDVVYIEAYGSAVYFAPPDTTRWNLTQNQGDDGVGTRLVMFERNPITDKQGRKVSPVIALIVEPIADSSDVVTYSVMKRMDVPFDVSKVIGDDTTAFSYRNAVGYEGTYTKEDVKHIVLIAHMRHKEAGIQIICDATDEVYHMVEKDFRLFIKLIQFDD